MTSGRAFRPGLGWWPALQLLHRFLFATIAAGVRSLPARLLAFAAVAAAGSFSHVCVQGATVAPYGPLPLFPYAPLPLCPDAPMPPLHTPRPAGAGGGGPTGARWQAPPRRRCRACSLPSQWSSSQSLFASTPRGAAPTRWAPPAASRPPCSALRTCARRYKTQLSSLRPQYACWGARASRGCGGGNGSDGATRRRRRRGRCHPAERNECSTPRAAGTADCGRPGAQACPRIMCGPRPGRPTSRTHELRSSVAKMAYSPPSARPVFVGGGVTRSSTSNEPSSLTCILGMACRAEGGMRIGDRAVPRAQAVQWARNRRGIGNACHGPHSRRCRSSRGVAGDRAPWWATLTHQVGLESPVHDGRAGEEGRNASTEQRGVPQEPEFDGLHSPERGSPGSVAVPDPGPQQARRAE